ncbi:MAG TPA: hypothetical protein VN843_14860, partial [Anaerolineales bacterium]|nr:hypothetical protein [Anaerolineales bacterium]
MKIFINRFSICIFVLIYLIACSSTPTQTAMPLSSATPSSTPVPAAATLTSTPSLIPTSTATQKPLIPNFEHIVIIMFENKEFGSVIGNAIMPNYNQLAREYTLLTQFYAVTHPSL